MTNNPWKPSPEVKATGCWGQQGIAVRMQGHAQLRVCGKRLGLGAVSKVKQGGWHKLCAPLSWPQD